MNRRHWIVLALYSLVTMVMTYPLVTVIGDHVPGTATWSLDEYGYVWNNWWFKSAVFDRGTNPFYTDFLFHPLGTPLVLYAYTLLHVLLALPLQLAFGLILAVNSTVLFSFVVAAFGMYLFLSYLLRVSLRIWSEKYGEKLGDLASNVFLQNLASFVGALAFAFTSNRFVYLSLGHYNIVASEWIPFYLLFLFKSLLEPKLTNALLAGLFAAFALYTETTDGVLIALVSSLILIFEWRLLNRTAVVRIALLVLTSTALFAPLLIPTLHEILASGYTLPGWGHSEKLLVDLAGFFTPTSLNPFNRHWETELDLVRQGISRFSDVNTFFVGYLSAILALIGAIRFSKRNKLWVAVAAIFAVLSLGPLLHINGTSDFELDGLTTTVPLPFLILHYIPLLKENRVPNRYSILATIGLAVLLTYALWWLASFAYQRTRTRFVSLVPVVLCSLLAVGLLAEHFSAPLPLTDATVPDVYKQIGQEPGDFAILSVPLGWRNSFGQLGAEDTRTQYFQAVSQKFILTGQIQRNPPILFNYFQRAPILNSIIAEETYNTLDDTSVARDRTLASEFVYFFDLRYLVVNAAIANRPPYSDTRLPTLQYLEQVLPLGDKIYDRDGTVAFRINQQPAPSTLQIDFGDDSARLYVADGWGNDEMIGGASGNWAISQDARNFVPLREIKDYTLTVRALPFDYFGHTQSMALFLNGNQVKTSELKSGWNEYTFTLPHDLIQEGVNELTWHFGYLARPSEVNPPEYQIGSTAINSPVDIAVESTPEFGSIKIGGREVSPLKRGYNVAVIDQKSAAILDVKSFDTGGTNIVESRALTDFINGLSNGVIVVGAVQGEAATTLGDRAAGAIKSLGLSTDLRGTSGHTLAFIAVKGRSGGLESTGTGTSLVNVGHSTDDRSLGVAFDWIRVEDK